MSEVFDSPRLTPSPEPSTSSDPVGPAPSYHSRAPTIDAVPDQPGSPQSVQYVPHSPTPSIQEVSPPPLRVRINPPNEQYPPLSPGSAQTLIRLSEEEFSEVARTVAFGLASTVERRTAIAAQQLSAARERINRLAAALETRDTEIRRLRARAGNIDIPHDYELNNGRIDTPIPSQRGGSVLPKWIKILGSGEVVARAGEEADEAEYVVPLYLPTDYSRGELDTMPYWCEELLQSTGGPFFALATAVRALDLTASAEVERYQRHHQRRAQLEADRRAIVAEIDREDEELTTIRHRLEGWRLHERVAHLQHRRDLLHE
jgi:hypothetical protein